jgi:hypothetical protein
VRYRLWLAVLALTCAGCTTSVAGTAAPGDILPTTTTTTTTAPPTAADGADLAACVDGTCEVIVAPDAVVDTGQNFGVYPIRVGPIGADDVLLVVAMINGGTFGCDGDDRCGVSVTGQTATEPAIAQVTVHAGAQVTAVGLTIDVVAVSDGHAIIRLTPTP